MSVGPERLDKVPGKPCPEGYTFNIRGADQFCLRSDLPQSVPTSGGMFSGLTSQITRRQPMASRANRFVAGPGPMPSTFGPTSPTTFPRIGQRTSQFDAGGAVDIARAAACGAAGLPSTCTAADLAAAAAARLAGIGTGGSGGTTSTPEAPSATPLPGLPALPVTTASGQTTSQGFAPMGNGPCQPGQIEAFGMCIAPGDAFPGGAPFISPAQQNGMGAAVLGLYGPALQPTATTRTVAKCPPGFVLGKDNLCYDQLPKSKRKWNPGAKPLLTGGEMNAIRRAASAAGRLSRTQKRIKKASKALGKAC